MAASEDRDERLLEEVAEGVADEADVAWEARSAESPSAASRIEKLKLIDSLGRAFRDAAGRSGLSPPAQTGHPSGPSETAEVVSKWGHLRLLDRLGEGSFGEVYRGHDPVLDRQVALKLAKASWGPEGDQRYLDEARRLAKVRHPNVVVVHGADVHDGRVGLWTDLVEGETLEDLLERQGPLGAPEAAVIGLDLCRALAAVHAQGLVHGDVKTSNVMRERGGRIVLMDFGTVKELPRGGGEVVVTRGTPLVLAPELLRGEAPTPAADFYSLGVLLYRLVSGRYPVEGSDVVEIARKHERGEWTPLRDLRPDLPEAFVQAVERALAPNPADRYASAGTMERALAEVAAGERAPRRRRLVLGVSGLVAALLVAAVAYRLDLTPWRPRAGRGGTSAVKARPSVAILGFKNLSGRPEAAWLSAALAEMLTTELGAGERLRTISGENVARMKLELSLAETDTLAADTLQRVRRNLGTDFVALGSFLVLGGSPDRLRVDVRLQDAEAGETVLSVSETGSEAELFDLVSRTGARLRARLGTPGPTEPQRLRASLPTNPKAARLYAEGLARLRVFEATAARALLEKSVAAQPDFAPAHSALAEAWAALGHDANAREHARHAFELSSGLSQAERLSVEARFREAAREWDKAMELYRSLTRLFPDDLEYGLRLAQAQTSGGKAREALATVEALRRQPPPASDDARIDLAEAVAADALADDRRSQAAAARAAEKASASGARLVVAQARLQEGAAWWRLRERQAATAAFEEARRLFAEMKDALGVARCLNQMANALREQRDFVRARAAFEEALAIFRQAGNGWGTAAVLNNIGLVLQQQGDLAGAQAMHEQALALVRELGDRRSEARTLNNLAMLLRQHGDLAAAKTMYEQALALNREIGDKRGVAMQLNNMAYVLSAQGELPGAQRMYEEALAIARDLGDRRGVGILLHNIGELRWRRGELERAKAAYEEALAIRRTGGDPGRVALTLEALGTVAAAQGDPASARRLVEEALAIRTEAGEKGGVAEAKAALAELALEEGRASEAIDLLPGVVEEFQREKRPDDEANAQALLGRALLAAGNADAGRAALERGLALCRRSRSMEVRLSVTVMAQRLRATARGPRGPQPCGEPARSALRALESAIREASRAGLVSLELEARLALGEAEIGCGRAAAGRARLAALEKEAKARGFVLLAAKAARAATAEQARR